jgi:hypothetical protein
MCEDAGKRMDYDDRLLVLRALRLKGRLSEEAADGFVPGRGAEVLKTLLSEGLAAPAASGVRLTRVGRDQLDQWLIEERSRVDQSALDHLYECFDGPNQRLKAVVTAWQLWPDGTPNDHRDSAYDDAVLAELADAHQKSAVLVDEIAAVVPRLWHYPGRLGWALEAVVGGDRSFVASPLKDSYHQIWFELHEDLISLLGRTRVGEAEAGRAQ